MRVGAVGWRCVVIRIKSMVAMAKALGMVVCGCSVVEMEKRENEVTVDVMFRQSMKIVLLRLNAT